MTIDDRDALDALHDRLKGANAVLLMLLEFDRTAEHIEAVRAAHVLIDDGISNLRALFKASPAD